MDERTLFFNGIDSETGDYILPGMSPARLAALARKAPIERPEGRGVRAGVVPEELASAGWGVVFPYGIDPAVRRALGPLIEHRRRSATSKDPRLFKELNYRPGLNKREFLKVYGAQPAGPVEPRRVPYYLLLVGGPRQIPFSFQYDLAVQYAVGRLSFETPEEYERYAVAVVEAENRGKTRPRRAVLFGTENPNDPATADTSEKLVEPLALGLEEEPWRLDTIAGAEASKATFARALGGDLSPALLFTVSHGLGYNRPDHPKKQTHQGALILSDWPGPGSGPVSKDHYFTAEDLGEDADLSGMITFHFACWSAGTPEMNYFLPEKRSAESDFVALLPRRLLAHENGGALAVVGHVDQAWLHSFLWEDVSHTALFESVMIELMSSVPVGRAMRYFGERSADLASDVLTRKEGENVASEEEYASIWTSYRDSRSYLILGDPAVRLRFPETEA